MTLLNRISAKAAEMPDTKKPPHRQNFPIRRRCSFYYPNKSACVPVRTRVNTRTFNLSLIHISCRAYTPLQAGPCTVTVGACGELTHISFSANGQKREISGAIGLLEYETFGGKEVDDCYFEYGRDLGENFHWAEPDFGKPGLRYHPEIQHRTCRPFPASIHVSGGQLYIRLIFPPEASEQYGCPREAMAVYRFTEGNIHLELFWKDKDCLLYTSRCV